MPLAAFAGVSSLKNWRFSFGHSWSHVDEVPCPPGHKWTGPWRLDAGSGPLVGWVFAFDFSAAYSEQQNLLLHNVRRRRWVRNYCARLADPVV